MYLEGSGFLGFSDGLHKSSSSESFNAAIPQASSGATVPEELKRVVWDVVFQAQDRSDIDDLHVGPEIIDHNGGRRRGWRRRGGGFEGALELGEVAGEGERGAEEERVGLQGPGREGGDESGGLKRVVVVGGGVVGLGLVVEGGEVGGDEAERVVLGAKVEEVVELGLALFHHTTTRRALRYRTTGVCCRRAPALPGQAVRAPHFSVCLRDWCWLLRRLGWDWERAPSPSLSLLQDGPLVRGTTSIRLYHIRYFSFLFLYKQKRKIY